ncbi:hypothetical protein GGR02_001097 [Anoxybacillus voinovskiensis]|uniref:Uncharacterized protein n=1 Tax=Anoxybacteroides voinovskiense TaxID=230470 RepID=A0A840DNX1_9BACL|nr:hypothetical protein [Anoxybacillus voinovskiensis]
MIQIIGMLFGLVGLVSAAFAYYHMEKLRK